MMGNARIARVSKLLIQQEGIVSLMLAGNKFLHAVKEK